MKFSKDDTLCMKGIAILILFFHHNYLGPDRWLNSPISFCPFSQSQIMYIAKFLKICVGMFVFLTGYGMLASVKTKSLDDKAMRKYTVNRYLTMMMGFWLIFLLVHILSGIFTDRFIEVYGTGTYSVIYFLIYGIGLAKLFDTPTFCATWWYMSLATMLILLFPMFKKLLERYQGILLILTIFLPKAFNLPYADLWRWLFCYTLGMYMAEHDLLAKIKEKFTSFGMLKRCLIFGILTIGIPVIIMLRQSEGFGIKFLYLWEGIAPAYVIVYAYLFVVWIKPLAAVLHFLGKHSMNMFLTHTMFRAVYFHDFMYSFYSMWLDYIALIIVSVLVSVAIEIVKKLIRFQKITTFVKDRACQILKLT